MTKRDVLSVAFRVLGVVYIVHALFTIPQLVLAFKTPPERMAFNGTAFLLGSAASIVLLWLAGVCLVGLADKLSCSLVRDDCEIAIPSVSGNAKALFVSAVRVFGVVMAAHGIPKVIGYLAQWLSLAFDKFTVFTFWSQIVEGLLVAVAGMALVFYTDQLAGFVFRGDLSEMPQADRPAGGANV